MKIIKKGLTFEMKFDKDLKEDEFLVIVSGKEVVAYASKNEVRFIQTIKINFNGNEVKIAGMKLERDEMTELKQWHHQEIINYISTADIEVNYKRDSRIEKTFDFVTINGEIKFEKELKEYFQIKDLKEIDGMDLNKQVKKVEVKEVKEVKEIEEIKEAIETGKEVVIERSIITKNGMDIVVTKVATPAGKIEFKTRKEM